MHFCQSVHPDTPVVVYSDLAYTPSHDSIAKSDPGRNIYYLEYSICVKFFLSLSLECAVRISFSKLT